MGDSDVNEYEEIYDPIRIKIQDKDKVYFDIGLKALYDYQKYTGTYDCIQFERFMIIVGVAEIKSESCHG